MVELDRQTDYWDRVADAKTFSHPVELPLLRRFLPLESRILDYGCGYGRLGAELSRAGYTNVTGVDISEQMIERGRRAHPALDLRVAGELPLPFSTASFDAVLLFAVLTCVPSDAGQKEIVREIERVLSPSGLLYASDYPLQEDEKNRSRYGSCAERYGKYGVFELPEGAVMRHHDPAWIRELLSGFEPLSYEVIPIRTMNGSQARAFQLLGRKRRN
ncbi:MAG: class I SAM-dependent methyltransferase [bacterium]